MQTRWPELNYPLAKETYETVLLWTQIVGKIKLSKLPWVNHSWHVTLLVTPYGLTTSDIQDESKHFQIDFNFLKHKLYVKTSTGQERSFELQNLSVAGFYHQLFSILDDLGIKVKINLIPNEMEKVIPFDEDEKHRSYDPEQASVLHQALLKINEVFTEFRSGFIGKSSPVHFFWGGFDLAVSRFSGKKAPLHPGGVPHLPDWVAQEAYSHEVSSSGFWPGSEALPFAAFYSYIYPAPEGYNKATIKPPEAYFHQELQEFILPYEVVQKSDDPAKTLLEFLQSTYEAGATLAGWDREALEKSKDFGKRG